MIAPALHARAQLSFTLTMQPAHYHYKKQSVKHMGQGEKKHCSVKNVVKSVPLRVIAVKLCKTFCFTWILEQSEVGPHKR